MELYEDKRPIIQIQKSCKKETGANKGNPLQNSGWKKPAHLCCTQ